MIMCGTSRFSRCDPTRLLHLLGLAILVASSPACKKLSFDLNQLPCDGGQCAAGYVCHPETQLCVNAVNVGCADPGAVCPSSVSTGDPCPSAGSFIPCSDAATNCDYGCRTCDANGTWSDCSPGTCTLGLVASCGSCTDDCTSTIEHASATCDATTSPGHCDYAGPCVAGFYDADGNRQNGCECTQQNGGVDIPCDGIDQDCMGGDAVIIGQLVNCAGCGDNCNVKVANATGIFCSGTACNYTACASSSGDADGNRANGCECTEQNGGVEICNNIDDDCNGTIDNGVAKCQCNGGVPSVEICDGIDNDCNGSIDEGFPCADGDFRDCDGGSGTEACDGGTCNWSGVCNPKDAVPPAQVSGFVAVSGNASVSLSWINPSDVDLGQCVVVRKTGSLPVDETDGTVANTVNSPTPGGAGTFIDTLLANGTVYYYAVFCRDVAGNWQRAVSAASAGSATPINIVTDLVALDGLDAHVSITYTMPAGAVACKVVRAPGTAYPMTNTDGTMVGGSEQTGGGGKSLTDGGGSVTNGTTYYYAAFCTSDGTYRNNVVAPTQNADTGLPISIVSDLNASNGEDSVVHVTFTMPTGATACKVKVKLGDYPTGNQDGTPLDVEQTGTGNKSLTDTNVTNGTISYYAVFCRVDAYRNDTVTPGANRDTGLPGGMVGDFDAVDGLSGQVNLTFTMPVGAAACKVIRNDTAQPTNNGDGNLVGVEQSGTGAKTVTDNVGATNNGRTFYYAVFCRSGASYVNNTVTQGLNADTGLPIAIVNNLLARDGEDGQVVAGFTMPTGAVACKIKVKLGGNLTSNADGTPLGAELTGTGVKSVTDTGVTNGTTYNYAVFCRSGTAYTNDTVTAGQNADTGLPIGLVNDLVAVDGLADQVTITFTLPSGAAACKLQRQTGSYPSSTTGSQLPNNATEFSGAGLQTYSDSGRTNGTTYYYAVFCRVDGSYRNNVVTEGQNGDTGTPLALVANFLARDGEDARVTTTFTAPAGTVACKVIRNNTAQPTSNTDGNLVGAEQLGAGAKTVTDNWVGLTNGTTYYYAVFCRLGASYVNNTVTAGKNADTGLPIARVNNLYAGPLDGQVLLGFTMPTGATACMIRRQTGAYPTPTTGTPIPVAPEFTGGGAKTYTDTSPGSAGNNTLYYYAVFCRASADGYVNALATGGINGDTARPIAIVANFKASDSANAQSVLTFDMPVGAVACKVMMKMTTGYPGTNLDGTQVGPTAAYEFTGGGAQTYTDTGLTNGNTYYYAVFCRSETAYYDNTVTPTQNADRGDVGVCTANAWSCDVDGRTRHQCNATGTAYINPTTCAFVCLSSDNACHSASNLLDTDARLTGCNASAKALTPRASATVTLTTTNITCADGTYGCDGTNGGSTTIATQTGPTPATDPVAVCVSTLNLPVGVTLTPDAGRTETRGLIIIVDGSATIGGGINFDGAAVSDPNGNNGTGGRAGPGGGNGGAGAANNGSGGTGSCPSNGGAACSGLSAGTGGGRGGGTATGAGGGGGQYGDKGGAGGAGGSGGAGGATGIVFGANTLIPLYGGTGGGGGGDGGGTAGGAPGAGGGGAVQLTVRGTLQVTGTITAGGGTGGPEGTTASPDLRNGAGGGGSGGAILLEASTVTVSAAKLYVNGGGGGGVTGGGTSGAGATGTTPTGTDGGAGAAGQGGGGGGGGRGRIYLKATTAPDCSAIPGASPTAACSTGSL